MVREGLPFAVALALATLLSALAQNRTVYLSTRSGIALRGALTATIYEHALKLTPRGSVGLETGQVTNLVATDTQKLYDVMLEAHNIWSCPVIILAVMVLLWVMLGPELIIGVVLLMVFVPFVQFFVKRMLSIRKRRAALADKRINILTSMLQGIQVSKLNHYEGKIEESVGAVRGEEICLLRKELNMWGWVLSSAVVSPVIAAGISFTFYALVNGNVLEPSDAFAALLFFSILRFPINLTARVVGKTAQASDAARRISEFLRRESRPFQDTSIEGSPQTEAVINVTDATLTVSPENSLMLPIPGEEPETCSSKQSSGSRLSRQSSSSIHGSFTIRTTALQVYRSQVVAVIGRVGAGKTLLLRALLGELEAGDSKSAVSVRGKIAYAAQQPFILNATLRDNVLFGSDYEEPRYESVIDACCLREDIQRLGPAGDLTEIGERGVTLSGGKIWHLLVLSVVSLTLELRSD